ncbi:MAG: ThuA domain-containing protein [Saprospiraceae bacterium]|nr:ThuA domain-containing protein [Saprospiraceae bacterium]
MKNLYFFSLLFLLFSSSVFSQKVNWKKLTVLVYSKNGKGYVHDNIPSAIACIQNLGKTHGFKVDTSSSPAVFTKENLEKYDLLVFTSTNNDVFDTDEQRLVFRHYIEAGGGLVGIHSVVGTERNWKWFKQLLGGTFSWHARFQKYRVNVIDKTHPSVKGLPVVWEREDECYFEKELYAGIHTFMVQDVASLKNDEKDAERVKQNMGSFVDYYPAAWHNFFDGGLAWITTLGHDKKDYSEPVYVQHILQGIEFVATHRSKKKDYGKSYAKHKDDEVVK